MRGATRAAVDELEGACLRAKRLKTESTTRTSSTPDPENPNPSAADYSTQKNISSFGSAVGENNRQECTDIKEIKVVESSEQHSPSKTNKGSRISHSAKSRSSSASIRNWPVAGIDGISPTPFQLTDEELDVFSSLSDPFELAIWVAQALRRIHDGVQTSIENDVECVATKRRSLSDTPGRDRHQSDNDVDIAKIAEREKKRNEQRLRKQRWRSEHKEENIDNDLRCRINARAKALYGINPLVEKTEFMEAEFVRRKARRNGKGSRESEFPGFTFGPDLVSKLFSVQNADRLNEVNAAGTLLINTLQAVCSTTGGEHSREAATALNSAFRDSKIGPRPFIEALRILSADSGVMEAINLAMKDYDQAVETDSITPLTNTATNSPTNAGSRRPSRTEGSPSSFLHASGLRGGAANGYSIGNHYQSSDAIKALNAATLILSDIAEGSSSHYVTPYGKPPSRNGGVNGLIDTNSGQTKESIEPNTSDPANPAKPLTKSQIDALLEFANGGSLMDNDDDDSVPDALDDTTEPEDQETTPQPDFDINATLQRIITELTADQSGGRDQLGFPLATSQADKAAALQRLFAEAGISINTVLPAAQAHATSQLYAHLSNRAHKFPTSGGINPLYASAFGNTAQMTQRMLSRPVNVNQPLQTAPSASRGNVVGPPARGSRGKSTEEIRKIREYGFPPLPGSRPGFN